MPNILHICPAAFRLQSADYFTNVPALITLNKLIFDGNLNTSTDWRVFNKIIYLQFIYMSIILLLQCVCCNYLDCSC